MAQKTNAIAKTMLPVALTNAASSKPAQRPRYMGWASAEQVHDPDVLRETEDPTVSQWCDNDGGYIASIAYDQS